MEIRPVLVAPRLIAVDVLTALAAGAFDATFMVATVALTDSAHVGRIDTFLASRALASKRSGGQALGLCPKRLQATALLKRLQTSLPAQPVQADRSAPISTGCGGCGGGTPMNSGS